jgi:uncharacterized protein YlxW (UPF0749 family)
MKTMRALCRCLLLTLLLAASAQAAPDEAPPLPTGQMNEQQLRAQLERARALNAELAAERKQLEQNLAVLEAQVAAKKELLADYSAGAPVATESTPWWRGPLADLALLAVGASAVLGLVFYWRRRATGKQV